MTPFEIVVAVDAAWGIGADAGLPWPKLPRDLAHFKRVTTATRDPGRRNAVVMGRKTWESIPPRWRPLDGRLNVVITRTAGYAVPDGVVVAPALEPALDQAAAHSDVESVFVVGGGEIYRQALELPGCRRVHLTRIAATFPADTYFPDITARFRCERVVDEVEESGVRYTIESWVPA